MKNNIQNISVKLYLGASIVLFVYSLGFFTNFNFTSVASEEFYRLAQDTNRFIFNVSFFNIVLAGILIGLDNHHKEEFTLVNFIGAAVSILLILTTMILSFFNIMEVQSEFLLLDYEVIRVFDVNFEPSTFVFSLGYVICFLFLVVLGLKIVVLSSKVIKRSSKES